MYDFKNTLKSRNSLLEPMNGEQILQQIPAAIRSKIEGILTNRRGCGIEVLVKDENCRTFLCTDGIRLNGELVTFVPVSKKKTIVNLFNVPLEVPNEEVMQLVRSFGVTPIEVRIKTINLNNKQFITGKRSVSIKEEEFVFPSFIKAFNGRSIGIRHQVQYENITLNKRIENKACILDQSTWASKASLQEKEAEESFYRYYGDWPEVASLKELEEKEKQLQEEINKVKIQFDTRRHNEKQQRLQRLKEMAVKRGRENERKATEKFQDIVNKVIGKATHETEDPQNVDIIMNNKAEQRNEETEEKAQYDTHGLKLDRDSDKIVMDQVVKTPGTRDGDGKENVSEKTIEVNDKALLRQILTASDKVDEVKRGKEVIEDETVKKPLMNRERSVITMHLRRATHGDDKGTSSTIKIKSETGMMKVGKLTFGDSPSDVRKWFDLMKQKKKVKDIQIIKYYTMNHFGRTTGMDRSMKEYEFNSVMAYLLFEYAGHCNGNLQGELNKWGISVNDKILTKWKDFVVGKLNKGQIKRIQYDLHDMIEYKFA